MSHPPKSRRFCIGCEKETTWEYQPALGHSRCNECGGMFAVNKNAVNLLKGYQDKKVKELEEEVKRLRGTIKRQASNIDGLLKKINRMQRGEQ